MYANWWQGELHRWEEQKVTQKLLTEEVDPFDPETNAKVPYVEDVTSSSSWDVLSRESLAHPAPTTKAKSKTGPAREQIPRTPPRRKMGSDADYHARMEQEIPANVTDEVRYLEERLAVLKDLHGLPPGPSP